MNPSQEATDMTVLGIAFDTSTLARLSQADDHPPRTLAGLAVPFGVASAPSTDGHRYRFSSPPTNGGDLVDVVHEHERTAILGRLAEAWDAQPDGLHARARVFATTRGNDVLVEAAEGARAGFSVGAVIATYAVAADGVRDVTEWSADHLGVVARPAFAATAGITVNASQDQTTTKGNTMTETATPVVELPTVAELAAQVAAILKTPQDVHPLAGFANFSDYMAAFASADNAKREALAVAFAVPDQIIADNPGLKPPSWRNQIKMNLDSRRPMIAGFGTAPLPAAGMDSSWPYLDPATDLDAIIADQANEADELAGIELKILKATESIKTAGTVSNLSYQLLMRATPSYLSAYMTICFAAWARFTEAKFVDQLLAKGTDAGAAINVANADTFAGLLFEASEAVADATGAPANLAYVDRASFVALGKLKDLRNKSYGVQNVAGVASAATLQIDVNGLIVRPDRFLPPAHLVVANSDAAKFSESGAMVASAENIAKLGRDVAVWGMYEPGEVYFPAGVRIYKPQV